MELVTEVSMSKIIGSEIKKKFSDSAREKEKKRRIPICEEEDSNPFPEEAAKSHRVCASEDSVSASSDLSQFLNLYML